MVNVNKLRGKIVENGLTVEGVADLIGIDKSTIYRKINGRGEAFTVREANLLCDALKLSKDEAVAIFFSQYVA